MDRQFYPSYAKIRLMRGEIKGFWMIVSEILSEICEDPTDAKFTVFQIHDKKTTTKQSLVKHACLFLVTVDRIWWRVRRVSGTIRDRARWQRPDERQEVHKIKFAADSGLDDGRTIVIMATRCVELCHRLLQRTASRKRAQEYANCVAQMYVSRMYGN